MYALKKIKFLPSYSLETNNKLFRIYLGIRIDVLDNFSIKNDRIFEIIKYPSLNQGALWTEDVCKLLTNTVLVPE